MGREEERRMGAGEARCDRSGGGEDMTTVDIDVDVDSVQRVIVVEEFVHVLVPRVGTVVVFHLLPLRYA